VKHSVKVMKQWSKNPRHSRGWWKYTLHVTRPVYAHISVVLVIAPAWLLIIVLALLVVVVISTLLLILVVVVAAILVAILTSVRRLSRSWCRAGGVRFRRSGSVSSRA